jgi:hypothetical protein
MSRPKVTFREGKKLRRKPQPLAWWGVGVHSKDWQKKKDDDEELPPCLAEIIQAARDNYAQRRTPSEDVRATLRALVHVEDEQAARAVRLIDDYTEAELATAAARLWKRENPIIDAVPGDLFDFQGWTPDRIRLTAKEALRGMRPRYGRGKTQGRDFELATDLAYWWQESKGERPTVSLAKGRAKDSEFLSWAQDMFSRAGRAISPAALKPILSKAIKSLPRKP